MTNEQTLKLIALISIAYPNRQWTDEQTELWMEMLADVPFSTAQDNVRHHIMNSQFAPTIAEVAFIDREPIDPEIYHRNKQIAHQQFVAAGGDPEAFIYEPRGKPRLTS